MKKALGVFCSDLHLSAKAPGSRKDDWFLAIERLFEKITVTGKRYRCPVFVAGDVFDKPKEEPVVVSQAIRWMKKLKWYGIPGQHDLIGHSISRLEETSFWTLVESGCLEYINEFLDLKDYLIVGYPWGREPADIVKTNKHVIGLGHLLVWQTSPFIGASQTGNVSEVIKRYKNHDVLVFGDNHKGFKVKKDGVLILNCGTACRRTLADVDYKPRCYVLFEDLSVKTVYLPFEFDEFVQKEEQINGYSHEDSFKVFVKTLMDQTEVSLSFRKMLTAYLNKNSVKKDVENIIWEIMESVV
ncbi:MAG TPA: metallophosphoesterase [Bacilli bacterium]|jgi:hypothetical protein|nr:metallophosphoesterase [Bacilli bacterium]